jgi:hypothetical protein
MTFLSNLTVEQLRKVVAIKEEIESLEAQLASLGGGNAPVAARRGRPKGSLGRRKMSAAAKAAIGAAQRKRWAKARRGKAAPEGVVKKKWKVSAATRAKLAAAAKSRWARAKETGQSSL